MTAALFDLADYGRDLLPALSAPVITDSDQAPQSGPPSWCVVVVDFVGHGRLVATSVECDSSGGRTSQIVITGLCGPADRVAAIVDRYSKIESWVRNPLIIPVSDGGTTCVLRFSGCVITMIDASYAAGASTVIPRLVLQASPDTVESVP